MEKTHQTAERTACILHVQSKLVEGGGYPRYQEQQFKLLSEWDPYWFTTHKTAWSFSRFIMLEAYCPRLPKNVMDDR